MEQELHTCIPGFWWGSWGSIFSLLYNICRSLFVLFPLCCLSFVHLRLLITLIGIFKLFKQISMIIEFYEGNLNRVYITRESVISSQKTGGELRYSEGLAVAAPGNQIKI